MSSSPNVADLDPSPGTRLAWVDRLKGLGLAWVFFNHLSERLLGFPYLGNPTPDWPSMSERIRQLAPLSGHGIWNLPLNLFRYVGWSGDEGVEVFLVASGFGLVWGLLGSPEPDRASWGGFFRRRVARIYPAWLLVHVPVLAACVLGLFPLDFGFLLSAAGLRVTASTMYLYVPVWWFISLILQLYLVFPLLWGALRRWGPWTLLAGSSVVCLLARAAGLWAFGDYLDPWLRGAVFVTRLPEFVLGMALACAFRKAPETADARLRSGAGILVSLLLYLEGTGSALLWWGMTVAPLLLAAGAFGLLYPLLSGPPGGRRGVLAWIGAHSLSLYLVHYPVIALLVPRSPESITAGIVGRAGIALGLTGVAGLALEGTLTIGSRLRRSALRRWGARGLIVRFTLGAALLYLGLIGLELFVGRVAPGEVFGWGERSSLEPDDRFGWRLKPGLTTRLRWEGYDYVVRANSLGFPGPEYSPARSPGSWRILVTGDAFTSAEGVDTERAWPRLLEQHLQSQQKSQKIEVLNFAVTGYGPNQYAAIVEAFAPIYRPDLVLVEMYVNEFEDALTSDEEFRWRIGFGRPPSDGAIAALTLRHLEAWVRHRIMGPLLSWARKKPGRNLSLLRGVPYLRVDAREFWTQGRERVADRLARIKNACDRIGAKVGIVLVPAAVQVCGPARSQCYPAYLDLTDASVYDPDRPQRYFEEMASHLGIEAFDLRLALRKAPECPHPLHNMHWTAQGHEIVANFLAPLLPAPASTR